MRVSRRFQFGLMAILMWGMSTGISFGTEIWSELLEQRHWPMGHPAGPRALGVFSESSASIAEQDLHNLKAMSDSQLRKFIAEHKRPLYETWRSLHRTLENLILQNETAVAERILRILIEDWKNEEPLVLPELGRKPGEVAAFIDRARNLSYEYALLAVLTRNEEYAQQAKRIILEFARVFPEWSFYDLDGRAWDQSNLRYRWKWRALAQWGSWYPTDMYSGLTLLRAYDTLRPLFSKQEQERVEQRLFVHHKESIDQFNGYWKDAVFDTRVSAYWQIYHNLVVYQWESLIRYAQVLQRPDWIHAVVRHWQEMMRYSYFPDGFFHELTTDYHRQITNGVLNSVPGMLAGYSDPEGYIDSASGERLDHLDFSQWEVLMSRIHDSQRVLALPDNTLLNTNDAGPARAQAPVEYGEIGDQPGLLGASGLAKLGTSGMAVHILYNGISGHDHFNALNLFWYAGNREVFSGTGYRPLKGSDNTREWNTITASHNTVMVDGENHFAKRDSLRIRQPNTAFTAQPPQNRGVDPVEVTQPVGAQYANHGNLLLWDAESEEVQAMEVAQEKAYPEQVSLFRRTVVLVPLAHGEGYLVDIFRVNGGSRHELFLRGGLDHAYDLSYNVPLTEHQETLYKYLQVKKKTDLNRLQIPDGLQARVVYRDGLKVISHIPGLYGLHGGQWTLMQGTAPAIRRMGNADYSLLRQDVGPDGGELETVFVRVNETTSGAERIRAVRAYVKEGNVFLQIQREGVVDYVLSGVHDESRFGYGEWRFQGKLAWARVANEEEFSGRVFSGNALSWNDQEIAARKPVTAKVLSTGARFQGEESDYVDLVLADDRPLQSEPRLVLLKLGDYFSYAIQVTGFQQNGKQLRLKLQHPAGFEVRKDAVYMNFWPGWRVVAKPTAELHFR